MRQDGRARAPTALGGVTKLHLPGGWWLSRSVTTSDVQRVKSDLLSSIRYSLIIQKWWLDYGDDGLSQWGYETNHNVDIMGI